MCSGWCNNWVTRQHARCDNKKKLAISVWTCKWNQLGHNLFSVYFASFVYNIYMFRTSPGLSSGGTTVFMRHLVLVILYSWLCCAGWSLLHPAHRRHISVPCCDHVFHLTGIRLRHIPLQCFWIINDWIYFFSFEIKLDISTLDWNYSNL